MKYCALLSYFAITTLFAGDPVFDGLDYTDLSRPADDEAIFNTPGFNLAGDDFNNSPSGQRINLAKYARVNADGFYHTDDGFQYTFDAFIPFVGIDRTLGFFDLRFTDFEGAAFEGNFGIGMRHLTQNEKLMWGVYGFYDRKKSKYRNFFSQISFGFEIKTKEIWGDLNLYIPVGSNAQRTVAFDRTELRPSSMQFFQNLFFVKGEEKALPGIDAEVGFLIPNTHELRLFGGFYYFNTNDAPTIAGPFVRATYRFDTQLKNAVRVFDYITLEAGARYDSERKFDAYLGFRLTVPLGGKSVRYEQGLRKYYNDYIRRDINIITAGNKNKELQRLENGTVPVEIMVADTKGLFDSGILNGDVIAVNGTISPTGRVILKEGQFLTGGYFTFQDDMKIKLSNAGTLLGNGAGDAFVTLLKNNTVRDITITLDSFPNPPVAIGNDNPLTGKIMIDNVQSNGIFFLTSVNTSGSAIDPLYLSLLNSRIVYEQTSVKQAVDFSFSDVQATLDIRNNSVSYTQPNNATGYGFVASTDSIPTNIDILYFTNNEANFSGNSNIGLFISNLPSNPPSLHWNIGTMTNNRFNLTSTGSNNFGVNVMTDSNSNQVSITFGAKGGVNCNEFNLENSTNPKGFDFNTDTSDASIDVFVKFCNKGLSEANGNTPVEKTGPNITIIPGP